MKDLIELAWSLICVTTFIASLIVVCFGIPMYILYEFIVGIIKVLGGL